MPNVPSVWSPTPQLELSGDRSSDPYPHGAAWTGHGRRMVGWRETRVSHASTSGAHGFDFSCRFGPRLHLLPSPTRWPGGSWTYRTRRACVARRALNARRAVQDHRGRIEPLEGEPQSEERLPDDLGDGHDALPRGGGAWARPKEAEQDSDPRSGEQRTSDDAEERHAACHQAGPIHQPAQDQPSPESVNEARAEQERPVMGCDERLADRDERARIRAPSPLPQR